ncbi:uncharacterized protein LOC126100685 [Schistocerca cancellata]|uniref:uncharacterized protein LOC126100685 n=1 Tax=Schistocerca cancellata TaxID=274614 RepID=UPI00211736E9|nr:uncharacterized protein LOC126100685 [Schistocerca cancellata]
MWPLPAVGAACVCALAAAALWLLRRPLRRWRRLVAFSAQLAGPALPRLSLGEDPLAVFADACRRYGTPCRVWVGARLYVLLTDPEHAAAVLGGGGGGGFHERAGLRQWDALRPFTGRGLATAAAGGGWSRRRRLVEQTLTPQWVRSQSGWLRRVADRLVAALQQVVPPAEQQLQLQPQQVLKELRACTLDALAGSLLGQQARATGRPPAGFPHHFLQATQLVDRQAGRQPALLSPLLSPLLSLAGGGQAGPRLVRQLRGYIDAAVDTAAHSSTRGQERHIALSWERAADSGDDPDRLPGSALEQLLAATDDRRLVSEELASLLLVGQPATEAALCFALQLLALHPQVSGGRPAPAEWRGRAALGATRDSRQWLCSARHLRRRPRLGSFCASDVTKHSQPMNRERRRQSSTAVQSTDECLQFQKCSVINRVTEQKQCLDSRLSFIQSFEKAFFITIASYSIT